MRTVFVISAGCLIFLSSGCRKDENPASPPPDGTDTTARYGSGSFLFTAAGGGGLFTVNGRYKPSDQFANDTSSEGAGGFVRDTSLFQRRIQALFAGYSHHFSNGALFERVIMVSIQGDSNTISVGDYPFAPGDTAQTGRAAYLYFFYSNSDSMALYDLYVPKTGTLTLTSFNTSTKHAQGTFFGSLLQLCEPCVTPKQIQITGGQFDLTFVTNYFNP